MKPLVEVNGNRGQKILQLVMHPPPPPDLGKKPQASNARAHYTSDAAKTEEFIVNEKFISFPQDHQFPSKDELRGKAYCKYHNSYNHNTNSCWSFRNVIYDKVNKEVTVKFLREKEVTMKFFSKKKSHCEVLWRKGSYSEVLQRKTSHGEATWRKRSHGD